MRSLILISSQQVEEHFASCEPRIYNITLRHDAWNFSTQSSAVGQIVVQFASKDQSKSCFLITPLAINWIGLLKKKDPPTEPACVASEQQKQLASVIERAWPTKGEKLIWLHQGEWFSTCDDLWASASPNWACCFLADWLLLAASFSLPPLLAYIMKRTRRQGRLLIALAGKNGPFSLLCANRPRRHAKRTKIPAYCWLHA